MPPIQLSVGQFLQQLLATHVESERVVVRMAYDRSVVQLNQGRNPVSYQRHNFWFRDFNGAGTQEILENMIERFMNSNEDFDWSNLVITIVNGQMEHLRGAGGGGGEGDEQTDDLVVDDHEVFKIPRNAQNLCGFIAVVCHLKKFQEKLKDTVPQLFSDVVDLYAKSPRFARWVKSVRQGVKLVSTAKALRQLLDVGADDMFTLMNHGDKFVEMFPLFRIVVVDANCKVIGDMCGKDFVRHHTETEELMTEYTVTLLYTDGHYDLLLNLGLYYRKRYNRNRHWMFCNVCFKPYSSANGGDNHQCSIPRCQDCKKPFATEKDLIDHSVVNVKIDCSKCGNQFAGDQCFEYHARRCSKSTEKTRCEWCFKFYLNIENHDCVNLGKRKCLFCAKFVHDYKNHHCRAFIEKLEPPKHSLGAEKIWAFDIECTTVLKDGKDVHVPNLIVTRQLADTKLLKFDTVDEFIEFLVDVQETIIMFAHNFGGYDGRVLFKYFVKHEKLRMVSAIPNGSKFMAYTFVNGQKELDENGNERDVLIKFRDSYRHMSQALRTLPKTYGLNQDLFAKGFYPHTFNKPENRFYKGPLPSRQEFHPDEMRDDEKKDFEKWYSQQLIEQQKYFENTGRTDFYDHYKEFVNYCESDVNVLAEALLVYMKEYMDQCNGLNPLEKVTIASHCMRHYLTNHITQETIPKLKPLEFKFAKEAFFGGRTHPCSLLVENSKIGYVDVNSLYPAVMVNYPLPKGDLKFLKINAKLSVDQLLQMHGILEVDVRPTRYLHHAIFPIRDPVSFTNSYPLAPLSKIKTTSIEIHKAIQNGYEVVFVYSALLTDVSFDLFKSYIYEAQTAKLLASGEPKEFETEEGKTRFIREYKQEMGVDLEGKLFDKNAGKRATAKLTNNSLWGKFGENTTRVKMTKYELIKDGSMQDDEAEKYTDLMNDIFDGKRMFCQNFTYTQDDYQVCYMFTREINDGYNEDLKDCTNVMLCAFVTANARMVLWDALNLLGDRVLYCDTDSIIYLLDQDDVDKNIKSSSKLGEWKDECEGDYITDFVSIAPKSYAYIMSSGEEVVKCKGVTLNYQNSKVVTFETLKKLVVGDVDQLTTRHLMFDCSKTNEFEINTLYRNKATSLNKNMLKGELLMKDNEWNLDLPRDYMIFPKGFEMFIDQVQRIYKRKSKNV